MRYIYSFLAFVLLFISTLDLRAQSYRISGTIYDQDLNEPIIGANVVIKDTSVGTITDLEGNFTFTTNLQGEQTLHISYIGYEEIDQKITINKDLKLGKIVMKPTSIGLKEVEIVADVAIDRKTPVAVSTISLREFEAKISNQDLPEILKSTPSVYTTPGNGGGFGDTRINVRGFDDTNTAVLVNGVPVNDMENGNVYWSNWAGLGDVTRSMQVQRGLSASKLALNSVGGTINIITKTTDIKKGGNAFMTVGNDGYLKFGSTLSTGKLPGDWAITASATRTTGSGYVSKTFIDAYSYYFSVSKTFSPTQSLTFLVIDGPQVHGRRFFNLGYDITPNSPYPKRANYEWGYYDGNVINTSGNQYRKPLFMLNHYWTMSDKTELSTSLYSSIGFGGGWRTRAASGFNWDNTKVDGPQSPYDFNEIYALNRQRAMEGKGAAYYLSISNNNHRWYGLLSTLNHSINEKLNFVGGLDLRTYKGIHDTRVYDLLGADYVDASKTWDVNRPDGYKAYYNDQIIYYNFGFVNWVGLFSQLEYSTDKLTIFGSLALNNTWYKREDFFRYKPGNQKSETKSIQGISGKAGANYNITDHHNVFINGGYFSRAPFFNAVYLNNTNEINSTLNNEKVYSIEVGYGYRSEIFSANGNLYYTNWNDRFLRRTINLDTIANLTGIKARHMGIEIDFTFKPIDKLKITGVASIGDWIYENDVDAVLIDEDNNEIVDSTGMKLEARLAIKGLKIPNSAQSSLALGFNYELVKGLNIYGDWNYYARLYADFDIEDRIYKQDVEQIIDRSQSWILPKYSLFSGGVSYSFNINWVRFTARVTSNNLLNSKYVVQATDNAKNPEAQTNPHTREAALGYWGFGRTWTAGLKINF
ncbi:TonB-dependent receptor [Aureibacter tunicatorum]|uniref:Outer membrane receptor protein involved in Fe transport n=1 Tax=Aureibacter tunicatorum TaxID=866807 RepID=A0AAE3XLH9_9BACT|nr:TonB-dependent receptor [Aureibacter tunicatorum]MDR6239087.1 outer membrane receptor protein involved in Fe transport [Aureibacter tunicatorum]BDD04987.1 TonB-dependent receptor [Aureibacter tunicatorum]